eukprot:jgi/Tetstr1/464551/TSEL_009308.t1
MAPKKNEHAKDKEDKDDVTPSELRARTVASCLPGRSVMRPDLAKHHPYVVRGAEVVAHATAFDEDNTHAWSRATFGEDWATATLNGVVRTVSGTVAVVRWEDGDEDVCTFDAMELRGETLRAAQASLAQPRSPSRRGETGGEAGGGASSGAEGGAASSEDEPLFNYAARGRAPGADPSPSPARSSPSPAASDDSHDSTASAAVAAVAARGRGRGRSAAPLTTEVGEHIVEDTDSEVEEEAEADADSPAAAFKLHGHTEKPVLDYFSACFPAGLVEDIAASMTRRGRELGYGALWEVTSGEFWMFLAYNMAILIIHSGGPKEDLWLKPGNEKYHGAFFTAPDLGQYGLQYSTFRRMMRAFTLPTYGDTTDPFDPVRQFVDCWNARMVSMLSPGPLITVDESMGLWTGKRHKAAVAAGGDGMLGWIFVGRKPTNRGRESHTTADCETGCIVFVEPYEGAVRMASKEFIPEWGKNPAKCIRCVKPWFGSGRCVIADSGFASVKCAQGLAEHGLFMIGNVKTGSAGFPKQFLLSNLKERGDRVCLTSSIKTNSGQEWSLLAAGDRDKQPMSLLGTAGTS